MNWLTQIISFIGQLLGNSNQNEVSSLSVHSDATPNPTPYVPPSSINQEGFNLLTSFEGCKLSSYQDQRGIWTIGYGHTGPDVFPGQSISQATAFLMLKKDLASKEAGVTSLSMVKLNGNQYSALVCFAYNAGLGSLKSSTLLAKLNAGDFAGANAEFLVWNKIRINGQLQISAGLTRRRQAEQALFSSPGDGTAIKWA